MSVRRDICGGRRKGGGIMIVSCDSSFLPAGRNDFIHFALFFQLSILTAPPNFTPTPHTQTHRPMQHQRPHHGCRRHLLCREQQAQGTRLFSLFLLHLLLLTYSKQASPPCAFGPYSPSFRLLAPSASACVSSEYVQGCMHLPRSV